MYFKYSIDLDKHICTYFIYCFISKIPSESKNFDVSPQGAGKANFSLTKPPEMAIMKRTF